MNHFSKWGLLQLGTVKYRTKLKGHVKTHFNISILPAAKQQNKGKQSQVKSAVFQNVIISLACEARCQGHLSLTVTPTCHSLFRRSWCDSRQEGRDRHRSMKGIPENLSNGSGQSTHAPLPWSSSYRNHIKCKFKKQIWSTLNHQWEGTEKMGAGPSQRNYKIPCTRELQKPTASTSSKGNSE